MDTSTTPKPPLMSPVTFLRFLETHRRTLPTRIDRSLMSSLSGGDQVAVLNALRFFGLIDAAGKPTDAFRELREVDNDSFNAALKPLLKTAFAALFDDSINLAAATQGELEEKFREYGITGDSVRKASAFFLSLARTAGVTISPHFKGATRATGTPRLRQARRKSTGPKPNGIPVDTPAAPTQAPELKDVLSGRLHRSVYGWIEELPPVGETWQRDDFDAWFETLRSMLLRLYKVA